MFTVELASYGLKLRSEGVFSVEDAKEWDRLYRRKLVEVIGRRRPFGQYVDLRGFKYGSSIVQQIMEIAGQAFKNGGGKRSAVIVDNPVGVIQTRRLAREIGIYEWERYIDPESFPDYERVALAWIVDGADPDDLG